MVGYEPNKPDFSRIEQMIVGGSSSILVRFIIQPLDVIKIRFQVIFFFYKNLINFVDSIKIPSKLVTTWANFKKITLVKVSKHVAWCFDNFKRRRLIWIMERTFNWTNSIYFVRYNSIYVVSTVDNVQLQSFSKFIWQE